MHVLPLRDTNCGRRVILPNLSLLIEHQSVQLRKQLYNLETFFQALILRSGSHNLFKNLNRHDLFIAGGNVTHGQFNIAITRDLCCPIYVSYT